MKSRIVLLVCVLASIALAFLYPTIGRTSSYSGSEVLSVDSGHELSILDQPRTNITGDPAEVTKIYVKDQLLGILSSESSMSKALSATYKEKYKEDYPNSAVGLGEDVYTVKEQSYFNYEDIDNEIIQYLKDNDLFSIAAYKVEFSNGAVIYVKDIDMFTEARQTYLYNFVSKDIYQMLRNNQRPVPLTTFGEQDISVRILEKMTVSKGLASKEKIFTTPEEIIEFLSYGYSTEKEFYTVKEYDTVDGVASQAKTGISTEQLIAINPGKLDSPGNTLVKGDQLNITYFNSPMSVEVKKERLVEENVYPEPTKYVKDPHLIAGKEVVDVKEVIGKRNVKYTDTYINGILVSGVEESSVITVQPVQEVKRFGIDGWGNEYNVGSGQFWHPVKNPKLTCGWGCYSGHYAADFQDRYNRWGSIYASDSGKVVKNYYDNVGGYVVIIDHQNDYFSWYGHMREKSPLKIGQMVSKGEMIGKIGMTGVATGPHVHLEIWMYGRPYTSGAKRLNPCKLMTCPR